FVSDDSGAHQFGMPAGLPQGTFSLTATDTARPELTATVTFKVGAQRLEVSAPRLSAPGAQFFVTVKALDGAGNAWSAFADTVHLTSSDGDAALPEDYTFTG